MHAKQKAREQVGTEAGEGQEHEPAQCLRRRVGHARQEEQRRMARQAVGQRGHADQRGGGRAGDTVLRSAHALRDQCVPRQCARVREAEPIVVHDEGRQQQGCVAQQHRPAAHDRPKEARRDLVAQRALQQQRQHGQQRCIRGQDGPLQGRQLGRDQQQRQGPGQRGKHPQRLRHRAAPEPAAHAAGFEGRPGEQQPAHEHRLLAPPGPQRPGQGGDQRQQRPAAQPQGAQRGQLQQRRGGQADEQHRHDLAQWHCGSRLTRESCPAGLAAPGGSGEIRTHGRLAPSAVFKTAALNHSATLPCSGF